MNKGDVHPIPADNRLAGMAFMAVAFCLFALMGAIAKLLLPVYSVGEVVLFRSAISLMILLPFVIREGMAVWRALPRPKLQVARIFISIMEVSMFFLSVSYLPLADTVSVFMAGPLFVAVLSMLLLGERMEWQRALAVLAGFAGVLVALRPSATTITGPSLFALTGTIFYACTVLTTRILRGTPWPILAVNQMVGATLLGVVWSSLPGEWLTPPPRHLALFGLIGILSALAYICINRAIMLAPANVVAPFQYTLIIWGGLFGYLFFGDVPSRATGIGAAIIAAAGLYLWWRERTRQIRSSRLFKEDKAT